VIYIQDILNEFSPCGGTVCPGCVTGCHLADSNVPDVDRMADALIEARAEREFQINMRYAAQEEADTLRTQLAAAREALAEAEWVMPLSNSSESCSLCGNMKHWGHAEDCYYITAALSEAP
jgi:hypothetical protein